jgi:hypothetical protein
LLFILLTADPQAQEVTLFSEHDGRSREDNNFLAVDGCNSYYADPLYCCIVVPLFCRFAVLQCCTGCSRFIAALLYRCRSVVLLAPVLLLLCYCAAAPLCYCVARPDL